MMSSTQRDAFLTKARAIMRRDMYGKSRRISKKKKQNQGLVKLTSTLDLATTAASNINNVIPLVAALQSSNDWASYAGTFGNFEIKRVTIKYITNAQPGSTTIYRATVGCAYDTANNSALTNINQIADYNQHTFINLYNNGTQFFNFYPKKIEYTPLKIGSSTEAYGWIKHMQTASPTLASNTPYGLVVLCFYVKFSNPQ